MTGKPKKGPQRTGDTTVKVNKETGQLDLHWPCLVIEGMKTGDGRFIPYGSLGHRGLPLSVMGQTATGKGHDGAEVFGKITRLERHEGPTRISKETGEPFPEGTAVWEAWGEGDPESKPGKLALEGYLTGNSADLADTKVVEELADEDGKPVLEMRGGNIAGTTLVPVPAFADGHVEVNGEVVAREPAVEALVAAADPAPAWTIAEDEAEPEPVTAAVEPEEPFRPPLSLFQRRQLRGITPLTLEPQPDGTLAVYGHAADFSRPHLSFTGQQVMARPSPSGYVKGFNTGALRVTDENGEERTAAVGRLVCPSGDDAGHADLTLNARDAKSFYDNPDWAWAWVQACDDQFGIQVNGVVIPGTPDDRVTRALAHPISGDWRPMDGKLELVAACNVNTPGIPVPRALVASGRITAMVAAGTVAPAPDNPHVMAMTITDAVIERLTEALPALFGKVRDLDREADRDLAGEHRALALEFRQEALLGELADDGVRPGMTGWQLDLVPVMAQLASADPGLHAELSRWHAVEPLEEASYAHSVAVLEDLEDRGELANWVSKAGGLPPYIRRIKKHLEAKGMSEGRAIATARNAAKKMCATGDLNFPGSQQVNPGSKAEACAATADWDRKAAS